MAAEGAAFALEPGTQEFDVGDGPDDLPLDRNVVTEFLPCCHGLVPDAPAEHGGGPGVGGALLVLGDLRQQALLGAGVGDRGDLALFRP
ncbi:hypothetical protein [Micromonospora sp. KC723]|uniref:hypothetical protein n=1 Tax=Micromonospora sp. KC723 TaxID=2530381 RepID=UPI001405027F|nr:hypothetical protein [Micromonospora sp. KC723]